MCLPWLFFKPQPACEASGATGAAVGDVAMATKGSIAGGGAATKGALDFPATDPSLVFIPGTSFLNRRWLHIDEHGQARTVEVRGVGRRAADRLGARRRTGWVTGGGGRARCS